MQWIFMLIGLVLGAAWDESITDGLVGAGLGLLFGQALALHGLQRQNAALRRQLEQFAERFDAGTEALYQRLLRLEQGGAVAPVPPAEPAEPVVAPEAVAEPGPELEWEIELPEAPAAASAAPDWSLQPQEPPPAPIPPVVEAPAAREASAWEAEPAVPSGPSWFDRAFGAARDWLFGGNTVLRVGVLLLFLGLVIVNLATFYALTHWSRYLREHPKTKQFPVAILVGVLVFAGAAIVFGVATHSTWMGEQDAATLAPRQGFVAYVVVFAAVVIATQIAARRNAPQTAPAKST